MLHDEFIGFLQKCHEYNFSVNVLTNLTLLDTAMIKEMKKNALLSVQTSLYAIEDQIHDSITGVKGSCEKTKKSILQLIENNIPLQISCPIMKENMNSYLNVIDWGKRHNINVSSDYVIIGKFNHTIQNLHSRLSISDIKQIVDQKILDDHEYLSRVRRRAEKGVI